MNQHQTINDFIEIGRQRKKRRLDLQRANHKSRAIVAKNVVANFTGTDDNNSTEKNFELIWNDCSSTLRNNGNKLTTSIITNYDEYLPDQNLQNLNHNIFFKSKRSIEEQELTSNFYSSDSNMDNDESSITFNLETEGTTI